MIVEFVHPVPYGNNKRDSRFDERDGWAIDEGRGLEVSMRHTEHGWLRVMGIGYTVLEPAVEIDAAPPALASTADSGAEVDQGLTGPVGSTPARSARKRK